MSVNEPARDLGALVLDGEREVTGCCDGCTELPCSGVPETDGHHVKHSHSAYTYIVHAYTHICTYQGSLHGFRDTAALIE